MNAVTYDVLAGLTGWFRWSHASAHYFVDGNQLCNTRHGNFEGAAVPPVAPKPADLSPHGQPYGRVCARCLKLARATQPAPPKAPAIVRDVRPSVWPRRRERPRTTTRHDWRTQHGKVWCSACGMRRGITASGRDWEYRTADGALIGPRCGACPGVRPRDG